METSLKSFLAGFKGLSEVKTKILTRLWKNDKTSFPKPWVRSSELLTLTGQKYFDRRIRELRDEQGCDIETAPLNGEHSYRIKSATRTGGKPRGYLTGANKKALFQKFNHTCQICGGVFTAGVRGLQADHKVPLNRGGRNSEENWQPICNECNVGKRGACEGCLDDCQKCPWAFPETVGRITLLHLPPVILERLSKRCGPSQHQLEGEITRILEKDLGIK